MEVVEEEHQRLRHRELFEQQSRRTVRPVALVKRPLGCSGRAGQRRKELPQFRSSCRIEPFQAAGIEPIDVIVQRVDEHPVGEILLELGTRPAEHDVTTSVRSGAQLCEQPALADPGWTNHLDRARRPAFQCAQSSVKRVQLSSTTDET